MLNVASNLLEEIQMESWHELNPHDQRAAIKTMTRALERVAQLLADVRSQPNYKYVLTHNNICMLLNVVVYVIIINLTICFLPFSSGVRACGGTGRIETWPTFATGVNTAGISWTLDVRPCPKRSVRISPVRRISGSRQR